MDMRFFKGRRVRPHYQFNNPNYTFAYGQDPSSILMDTLTPPEEQETVNITREEGDGNFSSVIYSCSRRETVVDHDTWPVNSFTSRNPANVRIQRRWKPFSFSAFNDRLSAITNGTVPRIRTWIRFIRSKLKQMAQPLPEQRWVVETTEYVIRNDVLVQETTESELFSKEAAEKYAAHQWNEQVRKKSFDERTYNIKIYLETYDPPTSMGATIDSVRYQETHSNENSSEADQT